MNRPAPNQFSLMALIVLVSVAALFFGLAVAFGVRMVLLALLPVFGIAALLRAFRAEFWAPNDYRKIEFFIPTQNDSLWYILIAMAIWLPCFIAIVIFVNGWVSH